MYNKNNMYSAQNALLAPNHFRWQSYNWFFMWPNLFYSNIFQRFTKKVSFNFKQFQINFL